ncbi:MAG: sugar phosphate isomerase/epimerase [Clostridia bacterium]|nr:sugar phosphate isomerase/epimerase [Clostridia bacterium]
MKLGAQLYTLREQLKNEEDIRIGLRKVADIGYKTVQVSNVGPINPHLLKQICDDNGLQIVVTHTKPDRLLNELDAVIEEHDIYNCKYIGIGGLPLDYRSEEGMKKFVEDFSPVIEKITESGKKFMYHHHSFEFARLSDGRWLMDHILDAFDAEKLGVICDTYWLAHAGLDICSMIKKFEGRLECVHLKDMYLPEIKNDHTFAPIGDGNIDFVPVIKKFEECGANYMFVEQDKTVGCPFEALRRSYNYLKTIYEEK